MSTRLLIGSKGYMMLQASRIDVSYTLARVVIAITRQALGHSSGNGSTSTMLQNSDHTHNYSGNEDDVKLVIHFYLRNRLCILRLPRIPKKFEKHC